VVNYQESLGVFGEVGDRLSLAYTLEKLAAVEGKQGRGTRAARLWGSSETIRGAIGVPLLPDERVHYEHAVAATQRHLDESTFAGAWAMGQAMSLEEVIAYARDS
jgi:hypothetical protein